MSLELIARKAGVSLATVSRVMNGSGGASKETISRVLKVVEAEGYRLPPAERRCGPKTNGNKPHGSGFVALVMMGLHPELALHPFYVPLISALSKSLRERQFDLAVSHVLFDEPVPAILTSQRVDGIFAIGFDPPAEVRTRVMQLPTVWLLDSPGRTGEWADAVVLDAARMGEMAAGYFLDQRLGDLAFLNIRPQHPAFARRGEAFARTAREAGATVRMLIKEDAAGECALWTPAQLRRFTGELLDRLDPAAFPQGIFVPADDAMAVLYPLLIERGIRPHRDVSLICGNSEERILGLLHPRPASIDVNRDVVARYAVQMLLNRIGGSKEPAGLRMVIPPVLVPAEDAEAEERVLAAPVRSPGSWNS